MVPGRRKAEGAGSCVKRHEVQAALLNAECRCREMGQQSAEQRLGTTSSVQMPMALDSSLSVGTFGLFGGRGGAIRKRQPC